MTDQIPPNKTLAAPPAECKTTFTGEDPEAIHPEHDPHLQDRMVRRVPSAAPLGRPKKTTEQKE
ncbi:hypothetical protein [Paludisphaera rhizosphaerae]|uniref:hypothetical protein n=1 Tax=Paludisphaera rhizosphaerae TaxID=2711216 RepID=UPI0013E9E3CA|nr:hypothetical protein [Paludisphaera rhizosphaerae]